jgi:hypothetical protein
MKNQKAADRGEGVGMNRENRGISRAFCLVLILASATLPACAALNQADTPATLAAQNANYATEIAMLDVMATQENSDSSLRAAGLATDAARINGINAQLVSTLQLVVTPTPQLEGSAFDPSTPSGPGDVGQRLYVNGGVSTEINSATGCIVNPAEQFSPFVDRLYAGFVGYNLTPGTLFRVEWWWTTTQRLMFSDSWTVPQEYDELCVWFYVTQEDVTFEPGTWQARLFVDEVQMTSPQRFEIVSGM